MPDAILDMTLITQTFMFMCLAAITSAPVLMAHAADDRTRGKFRELIREMRNA